jgi:trans-aconitate 2-methyltransferase
MGQGYGFDAKRYRDWSQMQKEWGAKLISSLMLEGDEEILDIGCGDGMLTARIAALVPRGRVLGIDSSFNMVSLAEELGTENLEFRLMDVSSMPFQDEFDVAFSNAALHWVTDHRAMLARVRGALRANGRIRINFAGDGNCSNLFRVEREEMASKEFAHHFQDFTWPWYMPRPEEYASTLCASGFTDVEVEGQVADRLFTTEELVNWIEQPSIVPLLEHLKGPELRQCFRDRVVARMVEETRQPDGMHFETFHRVDVRARR